MKKIIVIEIVVLAVLLTVMGIFTFQGLTRQPQELTHTTDQTAPGQHDFQRPTEAPTEPPTEAPTEPPVVVELAESWIPHLQGKDISAKQYFVYDCTSQSFLLLSCDRYEAIYPASVTKLFSAYVALQHMDPSRKWWQAVL